MPAEFVARATELLAAKPAPPEEEPCPQCGQVHAQSGWSWQRKGAMIALILLIGSSHPIAGLIALIAGLFVFATAHRGECRGEVQAVGDAEKSADGNETGES